MGMTDILGIKEYHDEIVTFQDEMRYALRLAGFVLAESHVDLQSMPYGPTDTIPVAEPNSAG